MEFSLKTFHQYLYGQKFKIFVDHKPLLGQARIRSYSNNGFTKNSKVSCSWQPMTMKLFTKRNVNRAMLMVSVIYYTLV